MGSQTSQNISKEHCLIIWIHACYKHFTGFRCETIAAYDKVRIFISVDTVKCDLNTVFLCCSKSNQKFKKATKIALSYGQLIIITLSNQIINFPCCAYFCYHIFQALGCDGVVGSGATVDGCGVCGGDGSSCGLYTHKFEWRTSDQWSACDKTCGYEREYTMFSIQ